MCSLVSADPSSGGCAVAARCPCGNTRSDSFSTPLRPPCRICGSPPLTRAERCRSNTRSMPVLLMGAAFRSALPAHAAREHLGQHGEVPTQAVERIAESGRRVAFEKKVPHPRGQVAGERHRQQPRPAGGNHRAGGDRDREQRTAHVQPARGAVAVFAAPTGPPPSFASFLEFYPYYLGEHGNRTSRRLHVSGTLLAKLG